jgi:tubulin polyglutamylase TTLL4
MNQQQQQGELNSERYQIFKPVPLKPGICWHFRKNGQCKLGDNCKFHHVKSNEEQRNNSSSETLSYMLHCTKESRSQGSVLRRTFEENGFQLVMQPVSNLTLFWNNTFGTTTIGTIPPSTLINHFPNSHELTNKSAMALNLQGKCKYLPLTFVLPRQLDAFTSYNKSIEKSIYWISKPLSSGEGRGIKIYSSYLDILQIIEMESKTKSKRRVSKFVVSEYIKDPLLIDEKKMDLRVYVLLVGSPTLDIPDKIYLYKDGIVRIASENYSTDVNQLQNQFIHITNNTINDKKNRCRYQSCRKDFGFFRNMNFKELRDYFDNYSLSYDHFWSLLKDAVKCSINLTIYNKNLQNEIYHKEKHRCFELLGFDILIDRQLFPHILEVNGMPDLNAMSHSGHMVLQKDYQVKSKMLADFLNLIPIPLSSATREQNISTSVNDVNFERIQ